MRHFQARAPRASSLTKLEIPVRCSHSLLAASWLSGSHVPAILRVKTCDRATPNGCTSGKTGSPRSITIASCATSNGVPSSPTIGPAAMGFPRGRSPPTLRSSSQTTTNASSRRATNFIRIGSQPISGSSAARCKSSARVKFPIRSSKRKCAEPSQTFSVSHHRYGRPTRRIISRMPAGSLPVVAGLLFCFPTGTRMPSPIPLSARFSTC